MLPEGLKGTAAHSMGIDVKLHNSHRFGDHGCYRVMNDEHGMPQVCISFIDSGESPFCEALNRMLADRFGKAIGLVERDIVTDHVTSTNAFASMLLDLSGKLAEFYGIECVTVTAR